MGLTKEEIGADEPGMKRIVLEDLEHGHDDIRPLAKNPQGFFGTSLEHALGARIPHAVHHVARHPERDAFGDAQRLSLHTDARENEMAIDVQRDAYLVKGDPEINVYDLARPIVHQNVGYVSIP